MPKKEISEIRKQYLQETDQQAQRRRFALFSQPPGLGIGDNSYTKIIKQRKQPDTGIVQIEPRQFQVSCPKQGKSKSGYFTLNNYKEDLYIDPPKLENRKNLARIAGIPKETPPFKDQNGWKLVFKHPYGHVSDFQGEKEKHPKNEMGKPSTEQRNIQVNPQNKQLQKFANTFIKDEYNRQDQLKRKERVQQQKQQLAGTFYNMDHGQEDFNKITQVFGTDVKFPEKKHDNIFRPSNPNKKGPQGTIAKFPKYMEDPKKELKRKDNKEEKQDLFKPNTLQQLSRPSASISCHKVNIRRQRMTQTMNKF